MITKAKYTRKIITVKCKRTCLFFDSDKKNICFNNKNWAFLFLDLVDMEIRFVKIN